MTEPRCRWRFVDILMLECLKISFALSLHFSITMRNLFSLRLIHNHFFPSSSRSEHYFFSDSTVSTPFTSLVRMTCLEADVLLPLFDFLHARRDVIGVTYCFLC